MAIPQFAYLFLKIYSEVVNKPFPPTKVILMNDTRAEEISLAALDWLCAQDQLLPVFLAASGADAQDLRAELLTASGPDKTLLVAVLDFILMRDDTVMDCCRAQDLAFDQLALAHALLSGTAQMHWT